MAHLWNRIVAVAAFLFAAVAFHSAVEQYGRPIGGMLIDPDGIIASVGLPTWSGLREGLRFPDEVISIDGHSLRAMPARYRATAWDNALANAQVLGKETVDVIVKTRSGERHLTLHLESMGPAVWWLYAGVLFFVGVFYECAALTSLGISPQGPLARTFAKTAFFASLYLFSFFDYITGRKLVLAFEIAFAMAPFGFIALALRLPDDVKVLRRFPWIVTLLDATGGVLAVAMIGRRLVGEPTTDLRSICTIFLGFAFVFFAITMVVRFLLATGSRRATLGTLLGAIAPPHILIGAGTLITGISSRGSSFAFLFLPALTLAPLATVFAFIRHDLWGSRALLSRVITRGVVATLTCALAAAVASAFVASLGVPFKFALIAATVSAFIAALFVNFALERTDRGLFPSRAKYKPTIDQLGEQLLAITRPEEVIEAVERTVRRWLACESVDFTEQAFLDHHHATPPPSTSLVHTSTVTLPIRFGNQTLAWLRVIQKPGGALFTSEDIDLLRTIGNQAALALAHAHSYTELEARRQSQAAAWRVERIALVETFAAEIAHEIRYPINFFRSVFQSRVSGTLLDQEEIEIGCEEVDRLERLVADLRRMVGSRIERYPVLIAELIARAETILRDVIGTHSLEINVDGRATILCAPDQVIQILINLLANAVDAISGDGKLGIHWRNSGDGGHLVVWDSGPGFTGDPSHLFAPWFTTKPRGTGLGLAITQRLVRTHGWSIDAMRADERTRFIIAIPASDIGEDSADHITRELE